MPGGSHEFDIHRLAALARLTLSADEHTLYAQQLTRILELASRVQSADTAGVAPTTHAWVPAQVERPDTSRPSLAPAAATANAPDTDKQWFRVPRVLG
jgi:aspartyl-tRNA(Asn)/glutamyl-tRNA(Gln) amidotransferase subunit C